LDNSMNYTESWHIDYELLTPAFMGGANPNQGPPELRAASLRGALRYWLRAVLPHATAVSVRSGMVLPMEAILFGGQSQQSALLLRLEKLNERPNWRFDDRAGKSRGREGRNEVTGLGYLGYSLKLRGGERPQGALDAGTKFRLHCTLRVSDALAHSDAVRLRRAAIASLWGLGTLGGIGARSRRGFGSLRIANLATEDAVFTSDTAAKDSLLADLRVIGAAEHAATLQRWQENLHQVCARMRQWFPNDVQSAKHRRLRAPHLDLEQDPYVAALSPEHDGLSALESAGTTLRSFRARTQPDYSLVKDHIRGTQPLMHVPPRVGFGLPLAFRYRSLNGDSCNFEPGARGHDRFASPLHIRVVQTRAGFHPVFLLMDGEHPGTRLKDQREFEPVVVRNRQGSTRLEPMEYDKSSALRFMQSLEGANSQ
jgi:CRISPR-associated protein Cmr1